jgi:hypothetical protein
MIVENRQQLAETWHGTAYDVFFKKRINNK